MGWFVDTEEVLAVMKNPKNLIEETSIEVLPEKIPDSVLDENVDINLVRQYFTNDAWVLVVERRKMVFTFANFASII